VSLFVSWALTFSGFVLQIWRYLLVWYSLTTFGSVAFGYGEARADRGGGG